MLVSFNLSNWKIFKDKISFSTVANTRIKTATHHPIKLKYNVKTLPFSAIYGPNNSGKTAFFEALDFAKNIIVDKGHSKLYPLKYYHLQYALDEQEQDTCFSFIIFISHNFYAYEFKINKQFVSEEKLTLLHKNKATTLFYRNRKQKVFEHHFNETLGTIFKTVPEDRLFINHIKQHNVEIDKHVNNVYEWFAKKLLIIYPHSRRGLVYINPAPLKTLNQVVQNLGLGIEGCSFTDISLEKLYDMLPRDAYQWVSEQTHSLQENEAFMFHYWYMIFHITKQKGNICIQKFITCHTADDNKKSVFFDLHQESDGTRRIFELIPLLLNAQHEHDSVLCIDEIDRSLHPSLTEKIIKYYTKSFDESSPKNQLIVTTHDENILDFKFLRKDEFWVTDRKNNTATLNAVNDFILKSDKKLSVYYRTNALGGRPIFKDE